MSAPKETEHSLPTEVQIAAAPSNVESGSAAPQMTQATPAVDPASAPEAGNVPPAKNVPLPQEDQTESEALDPHAGQPAEDAELGAETLEEAQVTQNALEAEVRMQPW